MLHVNNNNSFTVPLTIGTFAKQALSLFHKSCEYKSIPPNLKKKVIYSKYHMKCCETKQVYLFMVFLT